MTGLFEETVGSDAQRCAWCGEESAGEVCISYGKARTIGGKRIWVEGPRFRPACARHLESVREVEDPKGAAIRARKAERARAAEQLRLV